MTDDKESEEVRILAARSDGAVTVVDKEGNISNTRPLEDGVPLDPGSDIVEYDTTDQPHILTRRTVYKSGSKGPAKVSSPKYREGWESAFGKKPRKEDLN